jgi:hypothetical protein
MNFAKYLCPETIIFIELLLLPHKIRGSNFNFQDIIFLLFVTAYHDVTTSRRLLWNHVEDKFRENRAVVLNANNSGDIHVHGSKLLFSHYFWKLELAIMAK